MACGVFTVSSAVLGVICYELQVPGIAFTSPRFTGSTSGGLTGDPDDRCHMPSNNG
jgi:hypothetical protein